jgi:GTP-binding protein HflX
LTDTVGFIRKLPHGLVEAFKATLEEVVQADLLLHVVDVSDPQAEEQIKAVDNVLREIGAEGKPTLMILNKVDQLNGAKDRLKRFQDNHNGAVSVSAMTGDGIPLLLQEIGNQLRPVRDFLELKVPYDQQEIIARLHEVGQVVERDYNGTKARFKARIPPHVHHEFAAFVVEQLQKPKAGRKKS